MPLFSDNALVPYLAGLFDGEGCIFIDKSSSNKAAKTPQYQLKCVVSMSELAPLELLHNRFGGALRAETKIRFNRKLMYVWSVVANDTKDFLETLRPYLVVKATECWLALEYLEQKTDTVPRKFGTPIEEVALREGFRLALQGIKHG